MLPQAFWGDIPVDCLVGENWNNCVIFKRNRKPALRNNQNLHSIQQLTTWLFSCFGYYKKWVRETIIYISVTNITLKMQSISDLGPGLKNRD